MDIAKKVQIAEEAKRKLRPTPVPTPPMPKKEVKKPKEVNPFMRA